MNTVPKKQAASRSNCQGSALIIATLIFIFSVGVGCGVCFAEEDIRYLNNRDQWPHKELWDELCNKHGTDTPPGEERCQRTIGGGSI